ncbi:MAG: ABC transporter ATP-binding protein [Candidatus Glassbacteria bacterium]|nr:ABC transporter ATP-binding protein [Candidatus Glassbacteria bacterium]
MRSFHRGGTALAGAGSTSELLRVDDLSVNLSSGVPAVDSVSFELRRGECLALVGESGCGKTLTGLSLLLAVPPETGSTAAGSIRLDGCELTALGRKRLRSVRGGRISMIFQDPAAALNPLFTIGSQVVETILAHLEVSKAEARQRALGILEDVGLKNPQRFLGLYSHQLSGGQCQRAMIAVALSTEPELLIADEPTTALDVTVQRQILDLLVRLRREKGLALLLITHNLALVAHLADRVLIMYAGQIVESASLEELFEAPRHPYTRALLECIPRLDARPGLPATIPGNVPVPGRWPAGCRFRERCAAARPGCERPQRLQPLEARPGTLVRCWLAAGMNLDNE